jgi:polyferredoxin
MLKWIRPILLGLAVAATVRHWDLRLVDLEPFDAYSWRAAALPTICIAVVSLIASPFLPMGYCQYGCPTGAVLGYLRRHARSDRLTRADALACGLLALGLACLWR